MRRALGLVIALVWFMGLFVSTASAGSITVTVPPPPTYPNWGCAGNCTQQFGIWNLTGGSVLNTNIGEQYVNEQVTVNVTSFVTAQGAHATITVDTVAAQLSDTGPYQWTYYNQGGGYHQIYITCDSPCQGNFLVSIQPLGAPTPTPTNFPTSTPVPFGTPPPSNTPVPVGHVTYTPTPSPTACVVDAWGCDQPPTATYVACESGVVVNYGLDPCGPTSTPTTGPTSTATPAGFGGSYRSCGMLLNCDLAPGNVTSPNPAWTSNGNSGGSRYCRGIVPGSSGYSSLYTDGIGYLVQMNAAGASCTQDTQATATGHVCIDWRYDSDAEAGTPLLGYHTAAFGDVTLVVEGSSTLTATTTCDTSHTVTYGTAITFYMSICGSCATDRYFYLDQFYMDVAAPTNTPLPTQPTNTPGPTWTPRPTATATAAPSATPVPPGYVPPTATILANIDTCLGSISDCSQNLTPIAGKAGGIPGLIATPMAPLNTSIFSPFQTIAITRGGCLSFGKMPILVPHISWLASPVPGPHVTVTPNITGYVPISVTWTLPTVVGTPMRQGVYGPIDPLEYEPCNDPAIPTWGWDLTWNASTFFEWLGFFVWTVSLLRRLFG